MIQETQVTQVAVTAMIQVEMNLANPAAMTPETPMIPEAATIRPDRKLKPLLFYSSTLRTYNQSR